MLYIRTTMDELELPIAVANSVTELAKMLNVSPNVVSSSICKHYKGWYKIQEDEINESYKKGV